MSDDPWAVVVGQDEAVRRLRAAVSSPVHAYLFVGPAGVGKRQAAQVFGAELLGVKLNHSDIVIFTPSGNNLRLGSRSDPGEIPAIINEATRSPTEGLRKVVIVEEFQSADPPASSALLKLLEEPPLSTIFVLLASDVPPHQQTIESRCLRVDFLPISSEVIAKALVDDELADAERAEVVARAASGSLERAKDLLLDERLALRRSAWWSLPDRLDGSGATIAVLAEELTGMIDEAADIKTNQHQSELKELEEREKHLGKIGSGRKDLETRQRRELRHFRTEELRFGFATLAARYHEMILSDPDNPATLNAIDHLRFSSDALTRNPNEAMLLRALLLKLSPIETR